ncbi:MAG: hypothetical protein JSW37_13690, partial [Anaerolineales bacterium]
IVPPQTGQRSMLWTTLDSLVPDRMSLLSARLTDRPCGQVNDMSQEPQPIGGAEAVRHNPGECV